MQASNSLFGASGSQAQMPTIDDMMIDPFFGDTRSDGEGSSSFDPSAYFPDNDYQEHPHEAQHPLLRRSVSVMFSKEGELEVKVQQAESFYSTNEDPQPFQEEESPKSSETEIRGKKRKRETKPKNGKETQDTPNLRSSLSKLEAAKVYRSKKRIRLDQLKAHEKGFVDMCDKVQEIVGPFGTFNSSDHISTDQIPEYQRDIVKLIKDLTEENAALKSDSQKLTIYPHLLKC